MKGEAFILKSLLFHRNLKLFFYLSPQFTIPHERSISPMINLLSNTDDACYRGQSYFESQTSLFLHILHFIQHLRRVDHSSG